MKDLCSQKRCSTFRLWQLVKGRGPLRACGNRPTCWILRKRHAPYPVYDPRHWVRGKWNAEGFNMPHFDDPTSIFSEGTKDIQVIGNIYENPELLNKKEN